MGGSALTKLEADCADAADVNAWLLTQLLETGATTPYDSAYGRVAGLDPGWSREDYVARHPLTIHSTSIQYVLKLQPRDLSNSTLVGLKCWIYSSLWQAGWVESNYTERRTGRSGPEEGGATSWVRGLRTLACCR